MDIQYDALGRRTVLTLPNQVSTEYHYDAASRLTALIYRNALGFLGGLSYQYDTAGNRISVGGSWARTLLPEPVPSATYDPANRQLGFGPSSMTFDDNGNLLTQTDSSGTIAYVWDARNRLAMLTSPPMNASFAYDALGRRAQRMVSSLLTQYHYDGRDVVRELDAAGDASYLRTHAVDEPLVRSDAVGRIQYLADALGSTMALTNPTGISTTTYAYEPYGRTVVDGPTINSVQYTGRENDATGLYYYRTRYYHPGLRRFLSEDAIPRANPYVYVANNPVRFVDPFGLAKGGRQRIAGDDPLIRGLGPKSDRKDIDSAIDAIRRGVEGGEITGKRKAFLEGWAKVAKRGFKYGGIIWILLEEFLTDVSEAGETPEELEALRKCQELNAKEKEPCAQPVPIE